MARWLRLLAFSLVFVVAACARGQASGTFDRTLNVGAPLELDVQTGAGSIDVRAGAEGKVEIHGRIRVGGSNRAAAQEIVDKLEAMPPIELDGNRLRIGRLDEQFRKNVAISYEIVVPAATQLRSRTGSGSQTVTGLAGPVHLESGKVVVFSAVAQVAK